jgi:hypothetical protein
MNKVCKKFKRIVNISKTTHRDAAPQADPNVDAALFILFYNPIFAAEVLETDDC